MPNKNELRRYLELSEILEHTGTVIRQGIRVPQWVRAEIASVSDKNHLYFELIEANKDHELAKCRATLWASQRKKVETKFIDATGDCFYAGQKILILCEVNFHKQYGFSLNIIDVSPEYTLGEAALNLIAMRETLIHEGIYKQNVQLEQPEDYECIAVISPSGAAGLGDFREELDGLQEMNVLKIHYIEAVFQGAEASSSLQAAMKKALKLHIKSPLDALIIIRGGGSVSDLAWLNDLAVARQVCNFPASVITGLGHARDQTLLDDVACIRLDTPSKVAAFIVNSISNNAFTAHENAISIWEYANNMCNESGRNTKLMLEKIITATNFTINNTKADTDSLMRQILGLSPEKTLQRGYALVKNEKNLLITHTNNVKVGSKLKIELQDGSLNVVVK